MKKSYRHNLYLALIHYPVVNKNGEIIASAVTNLDLHDMARAARTYGVRTFYVVTPLEDQKALVKKIAGHWVDGFGGEYNPARKKALGLIQVEDSIENVKNDIENRGEGTPRVVVTTAASRMNSTGYGRLREILKEGRPCVLTLGTAWGLTQDFIEKADDVLAPIQGVGDYNHLSVRSATSIILDRLLGDRE